MTSIATTSATPARAAESQRDWRGVTTTLRYVLLCLLAIIFLFPIVFMLVSSLKPNAQMLTDSTSLNAFLPIGNISFNNYKAAFERVPTLRFITNSVIVTTTTVLLGLLVNSLAGFSLGCMQWKGQRLVLTVIIATLIVPFETIAIPLLLIVSRLPGIDATGLTIGWLNSCLLYTSPSPRDS